MPKTLVALLFLKDAVLVLSDLWNFLNRLFSWDHKGSTILDRFQIFLTIVHWWVVWKKMNYLWSHRHWKWDFFEIFFVLELTLYFCFSLCLWLTEQLFAFTVRFKVFWVQVQMMTFCWLLTFFLLLLWKNRSFFDDFFHFLPQVLQIMGLTGFFLLFPYLISFGP